MDVNAAEFPYSETKLCERHGISRTDMKSIRDAVMRQDRDWKKIGGEIGLSKGGVKRLWRELPHARTAFDLEECLLGRAKKNGAIVERILLGSQFAPIPVTMRVTRVCSNPQVVLAVDEHKGLQSVWVGRNENFTIGMQLQVVPHAQISGFWRMSGEAPRRRYTPDEWERRQRAGVPG